MAAIYVIVDGEKFLQLEDGSRCPVVAPLSLDAGTKVALIATQETLIQTIINRLTDLNATQASNWEKLQSAVDLVQTITYLDAGDVTNERVNVITYSSTSLNLTMTETFNYAGSSGSYRLVGVTRS